jgi:hypothetical protein
MNLYQQYKAAWDVIAESGFPAVAEMARHFTAFRPMEQALGYGASVCCKWVERRGGVSNRSEMRARNWLDAKASGNAPPKAEPVTAPAHAHGDMLLIVCPPGITEKAKRVLALMGCEVTDI